MSILSFPKASLNSPPQGFLLEKLDTMVVLQHDPKTVRAPRYAASREWLSISHNPRWLNPSQPHLQRHHRSRRHHPRPVGMRRRQRSRNGKKRRRAKEKFPSPPKSRPHPVPRYQGRRRRPSRLLVRRHRRPWSPHVHPRPPPLRLHPSRHRRPDPSLDLCIPCLPNHRRP